MQGETVYYYDARTLCQAWVADALHHGSVKGICYHLGISAQQFSAIRSGRELLPHHLVEAFGLLPVRAVRSATLVGYVSREPVDFARQWMLPDPVASGR